MNLYPIRESRNFWFIPICFIHKCNSLLCSTFSYTDNQGTLQYEQNLDYVNGACNKKDSIYKSKLRLYNFCNYNNLYNSHQVVIPDLEFDLYIHFPLTHPLNIRISKMTSGYSLHQIIYIIQYIYKLIYFEEEQTATPMEFEIQEDCICVDNDLLVNVERKSPTSDECCICYNSYTDTACVLSCNHEFHEECLRQWIHTGNGTKCPLCRTFILQCEECGNTRIKVRRLNSVVLPPELRFGIRPSTNGIYGINTYYFEQLVIDSLIYNQYLKRLDIHVYSDDIFDLII